MTCWRSFINCVMVPTRENRQWSSHQNYSTSYSHLRLLHIGLEFFRPRAKRTRVAGPSGPTGRENGAQG